MSEHSPQSVGEDVFSAVGEYFEEFTAEPENFDDQAREGPGGLAAGPSPTHLSRPL
jgi:hypothetical protein